MRFGHNFIWFCIFRTCEAYIRSDEPNHFKNHLQAKMMAKKYGGKFRCYSVNFVCCLATGLCNDHRQILCQTKLQYRINRCDTMKTEIAKTQHQMIDCSSVSVLWDYRINFGGTYTLFHFFIFGLCVARIWCITKIPFALPKATQFSLPWQC